MTTNTPENFYVTGGTLRRDTPSYVARRADEDLYDGLQQGQFCYVLTSRQMGKSSLMVQTAARLREAGTTVAVLDLTAIGQNLTAEQWYDDLLGRLGEQVELETELEEFWLAHERLGSLSRWMRALTEVVLPRRAGQVVIFVDEIDGVRSLPFSTDEFFAAIRELYNRRTAEPDLARLTFCLLGVATPSDLIRDTRTTPFNIGRRIELNDFTEAEAAPLAEGLGRDEATAAKLLHRILYWTGGHPSLTQRLCQATADSPAIKNASEVDRLCEELFFSTRARERDDNLLFVRERMLRSEADLAGLLDLYAQVHKRKRVPDDETNPLVSVLRLSGITRVVEGRLQVRNQIYERVFDRGWITANMPDAELHRQCVAYRRGLLRATTIATTVLILMSILVGVAINQRNLAKLSTQETRMALAEAEKQRKEAERQEAEAKMALAEAENQRTIADAQRQQAVKQKKIAEHQRNLANEQTRRAEMALAETENQRKIAEDQGLKVVEQKEIVKQKQTEAEQQRHRIEQIETYILEQAKKQDNPFLFEGYKVLFPNNEARGEERDQYTRGGSIITGTLRGRVYEYGNPDIPIAGTEIILVNVGTGIETTGIANATGEFQMEYLKPGEYKITARHPGYEQTIASTANVLIKLKTLTTLMPPPLALRKKR